MKRGLRTISLGMFWIIGLFGWFHLILAFLANEDNHLGWLVITPIMVLIVVMLFDLIVLDGEFLLGKLQLRTLLLLWFLGVGYGGGIDFIQQQHSFGLLIVFQTFAYTPVVLAFLYFILVWIISREKHSE